MSNSHPKDAHAQPQTGADTPAISELESRHTNGHQNGNGAAPHDFGDAKVWDFSTATRDEPTFRAIRDKYPDFDLATHHDANAHLVLVWKLRCQHDATAVREGIPLDDMVERTLRSLLPTNLNAAPALSWLKNPKATFYKSTDAQSVARKFIKQWATPTEVVEEWSEPLPLGNALLPVPVLPPALIPEPLRDWVMDCAERVCCPVDYVTVAALVALASLVGNTVCIRPKKHDDWQVVPNLWGAAVGSPSVKKSPAMSEGLAPLSRLKAQAVEKWRAEMKAWKADELLDELDGEALKKKLKGMQGKVSREELRAFIEQESREEKAKPEVKTYSVQDATIEALAKVLERNPRGFLMQRDELAGWLRALDKQGHEQDRMFFTECFDGAQTNQQIERIGRGTMFVPHYTISVLGTIQPLPFAQLIRAASAGADADGFVARFQMLVYPDLMPYNHVDRSPDIQAKDRAFAIFEKLDALTPETVGALGEEKSRRYLRFSGGGQTVFNDWIINLENRLRSQSPLIEQHLAKYRSLMPSLALLFHLIAVMDGTQNKGPVSERAAMMAAEWCEFLEAHARRVYAMASDGATDGAELIVQRFGDLENPFTARDVHRKHWQGLKDIGDVEAALARLEDRGWIQAQTIKGETGRPTARYWKHPAKTGQK
jgi:putative DNA primase/helicase